MTTTGGRATRMEHVLVVKLGALGDLVLADGALRDLRERHRDAHITLLTRRAFAPLMQRCPWVDAVLADENAPRWRLDRMLALRRRLHAGAFDAAYDLQNSRRSRFYRQWLSASKTTWSFEGPSRAVGSSVPARHAAQLRAAGLAAAWSERPSPGWIATDAGALLAQAGLKQPFVALLPGSSARHPEKRWPHHADLAARLTRDGLVVATIPGIDEPDIANGFEGTVLKPDGRVLGLPELAGVLRQAACAVGSDSGPTHLAACLGTPVVALFARGSPGRVSTGIETRGARCLDAPVVAGIPVDDVRDAVRRQLAGHGGPASATRR